MKQIVITGISSDLGKAIGAVLSADPGTQIIGTMRRKMLPEETALPNMRIIEECDLTDSSACERLGQEVANRFKGPFGFVHSVGDFWDHVPFSEVSPDRALHVVESHVDTLYRSLYYLIPVMKSAGGGSVVSFSCHSVNYNYPWMAAFTAAKSAVESLMRSLANEYSGDGLRFNAIVLASLRTAKVQKSKPHGDFAHFTPPEDIAPIVRFLLSKEAYLITGNAINLFVHSDEFFSSYFKRVAK